MNLKSLQEKLNNEDLTLVAQIQDTIYTSQLKECTINQIL